MLKRGNYLHIGLCIIAWIIFVGLSIEAAAFLTKTIATLVLGQEGAKPFWTLVDLSELYNSNESHYVTLSSLVCIVAILKAILFYFIVRIFHDKNLDLTKPFNKTVRKFLLIITYLVIGIGLFALWGTNFAKTITEKGISIPDLQTLKLAGADVWLFMGVILLVIAQVFKKAIEIQHENDLTV